MATILVIDDDTALLAACRVGLHALGIKSVRPRRVTRACPTRPSIHLPSSSLISGCPTWTACRSSTNCGGGRRYL